MAPRIVCFCQPVTAAICSTVAPSGRFEQLDQQRLLGAGAGRGLVGRCGLGRLGSLGRLRLGLALARCRRLGGLCRLRSAPAAPGLPSRRPAPSGAPCGASVAGTGDAAGSCSSTLKSAGLRRPSSRPGAAARTSSVESPNRWALRPIARRASPRLAGLRGASSSADRMVASCFLLRSVAGHGMISIAGEHHRPPTSPSPGGWRRAGRGREIGRLCGVLALAEGHVGDRA